MSAAKAKPHTRVVLDALRTSGLSFELRHVIRVYCDLANRKTGKGWYGQETIAAELGCSKRTLVRYLIALRELPGEPWIVWQRRSKPDGRGRNSDVYTVNVGATFKTPPVALGKKSSRRHPWHVESDDDTATKVPNAADQSVKPRLTKVPTVAQDPVCDPVSGIQVDFLSPTPATIARKSKPKKSKHEYTPEQKQAHARLTKYYHEEFERLRCTKPIGWGAKEGRAIYELLAKLDYDVAHAEGIITSGLQGWNKATIMWIAANPSACVGGAIVAHSGLRGGDRAEQQRQRANELKALEDRQAAGAAS